MSPALVRVALFDGESATDWRATWTSIANPENVSPAIVDSRRALEVRVPSGRHEGTSLEFAFAKAGYEEPEESYFRYALRFNDSWQLARGGEIGKLPGFGGTYDRGGWGGRRATGRNGWSARMAVVHGSGPTYRIGFYTYHVNQPTQWGEHMLWDGVLVRNRWYVVEAHVRLNTPGRADGVLEGWVDDRPVFARSNLRFRDVPALRVEKVWGNVYVGGEWTADRLMRIHFDDMVVAASRVGTGTPARPGCFTSSNTRQSKPFPPQSGRFTAVFDVIPEGSGIDGVTGLAASPASDYTHLAAAVRFNAAGHIDARRGGEYAALTPVAYTSGVTYRVRLVVNVPARTYSIHVTPAGGVEQAIGVDFAFRTEQQGVRVLTHLASLTTRGTHLVCGFLGTFELES
jgi:hypothetical protein